MTTMLQRPAESSSAEALHERRRHRWTVDQYMEMSDAGFLNGHRTELIDGEILDVAAQNNPHVAGITNTAAQLFALFPAPEFWVRVQATLRLGNFSAPDPDFAIAPGPVTGNLETPITPLLVIEVSDTTLLYDQQIKSSLYAAHGIEDYWIINLPRGQLEIHRQPIPDATRVHGWRYARIEPVFPPNQVAPLFKLTAQVEVAKLFP